ncbi:MAG: NifB/NifX family molybdenum-iron cluster-binding protein [Peptococcaceae bacterium]|nr:NifB/NifX family molybdenum-iron cluster-binding protein [Peptococcaceae bacterium]
MLIALPTRDGKIDDHFGHCDHYTVITVENGKVIATESLPSPEGCGCKSDIAPTMARMGIRLLLAGNMGDGALTVLRNNGIKVIRGCKGPIEDVIADYLAGKLVDNQITCDHHECDHH